MRWMSLLLALALPFPAAAQDPASEDVAPGFPFEEGEVISFDSLDKLKNYLPPTF